MAKRYKMSRGKSKRQFVAKAHTHKKNLQAQPMRGGFRI